MKEDNIIEIEEVERDEEENNSTGALTKVKSVVKKHSKKIIAGALIVGGVIIGCVLSKKHDEDDSGVDATIDDSNVIDVEYSEETE